MNNDQDIVQKLREHLIVDDPLCHEAADEIERLRAEIERARNELSAALGWPGGITAELFPWSELLAIVARDRVSAAKAVAAERERCAAACEREAEKWEGDGMVEPMARLCAIAIRAGR